MRYENIKSGLLGILVLLSAVLTWNLWTYQPNYDPLKSSKNVKEVAVSEKKEQRKIIKPDRIVYHSNKAHFGNSNGAETDKLIKEMGSWTFSGLKNITDRAGNFKQLIHGDGTAEIIFPNEVPVEVYRNVLRFEEKEIPSFKFDRIVIDLKSLQKDRGVVYFASVRNQEIYISYIPPSFLNEFNRTFFKGVDNNPPYFAFEANEKRTIFLPEGETEMMQFKYLPVNLKSEDFKEALFSDPSYVQKSFVSNGEEYTNDSSKMNINEDNMLVYLNFAEESDYLSNSNELLKRSIDFINEHGGWTDPYRFAHLDEFNQRVTFRLYSMDGYPVFNPRGLTELTEVWGRNNIVKYMRPNFSLELPLEMTKVQRPSGHVAIEFLKQKGNFKPELLEELELGYRMERDQKEKRLILLEPAWFYRYNKAWGQITMEDLGGMKHGLE